VIGQDIVQLGHYYARTKFGCITRCDSADFNGVDGILGIGMPDAGGVVGFFFLGVSDGVLGP